MNKLPVKFDHKEKPLGGAFSIKDPDFLKSLSDYIPPWDLILNGNYHTNEFCEQYLKWIKNSRHSGFKGLEDFPHYAFSAGTTESFDKFYMKNHSRRFRCFRGEYLYHELTWRNCWPNWSYIETEEINTNDAVVISLPFADTGDCHKEYRQLMEKCTELKVPVLVDCAYFGLVTEFEFDLSYPCITDVTFSLSKYFPIAHARVGMRLTRNNDDDPLFVYQRGSYNNKHGAVLGQFLMSNFDCDFLIDRYRQRQIEFSEFLNICPTRTIMFALGDSKWQDYSRGGELNRLSFHKYLHLDTEQFKTIMKEHLDGNLLAQ